MIKVGVITHWGSLDNYGQTIQAYALQKALNRIGVDSYLIRYTGNARKSSLWGKLLKLNNIGKIRAYLQRRKNDIKNDELNKKNSRDLRLFLEQTINLAPQVYSRKDILANPPVADVFITGSDQVWNKLDRTYYLDFAPDSARKISYAASFGSAVYENKQLTLLSALLKPFESITVREKEGMEMCRKAGRPDAYLVPDPTMLLTSAEYASIASPHNEVKPYILLYMLGNKNEYDTGECYAFGTKHNLEIRYVASQRQFDEYPKIYPSMGEWLGLIKNATFVITNSFHGTVFSLIFNKQFITVPLSGTAKKMNNRIDTLLQTFDLQDRLTNDNLTLLNPIDYDNIRERLNRIRQEGLSALSSLLETKV